MNAAERALLRERVKLVNILEAENKLFARLDLDKDTSGLWHDYRTQLKVEVAELDAALKLLKESKPQ